MYVSSIRFSIWCDFIERAFLDDEFLTLIKDEVINGATSNPSIFNQAFLNSQAYKEDILKLNSNTAKEIYEALAIEDISNAASKLMPLYEKNDDGFVSIEVDPFLANDAQATIQEGRRLYKSINKPNVMIKIPATNAGYEAMEVLMSEGINVNATLVFSPKQAQDCLEALCRGLEYCNRADLPKAVISVFVSRFDRKLDNILEENNLPKAKVGIFNAIKIYKQIEKKDNENIRCLFASTGVKGDELEPEYYIEKLLFPNAINTAPLDTINAFVASGKSVAQSLPSDEDINIFFKDIEKHIDMEKIYTQLMNEGMKAFEDAFTQMLEALK